MKKAHRSVRFFHFCKNLRILYIPPADYMRLIGPVSTKITLKMTTFKLSVNNKEMSAEADADTPLLWILRDHLNLVEQSTDVV